MFEVTKVERQIGGKTLTIETGKIARQAHGSVLVQCGDTVVHVTATSAKPRFDDIDYFPLSVDYREKLSAAGKFPGGFMKREGRPTTKEILTARMIDRPIRPLFPDGYFDEVQILCNVLSADTENDPDVLAMVGASAALVISKIPFQGPLGACRLSRVNGEFIINPTHTERESSDYNLVLGGRREAINMIEVDAKQMTEDVVADGIETAHKAIIELCDMLDELREKCGVEKEIPEIESNDELAATVKDEYFPAMYKAVQIPAKADRSAAIKEIVTEATEKYTVAEEGEEPACSKGLFKRIISSVEKAAFRTIILEGKRSDGRGYDDVRPIECEVGLLPRAHGSALFTRAKLRDWFQ